MALSLKDRLLKNSTLDHTASLEESKMFTNKDMIPTPVPMVNIALSASFKGGMVPGLTMIAGESKHFKSGFCLLLARAYLDKYPDGIILFYDSEFGSPASYFSSFNIPPNQVVHSPITNIEEFKIDIMAQLKDITRDDKVMIIVDSIGNLASLKEITDAENAKTVGDMTRAKALKGLFRMVGPKLTIQDIPMVVINHVYDAMELFPKAIVSGGKGSYYNSDNIWIIGRSQEKDSKDQLSGYNFVINIEKSRYVREKSKIAINISFEGGINKWSGLFELALEGKFIIPITKVSYGEVNLETGEIPTTGRSKKTMVDDSNLWKKLLDTPKFVSFVEDKYRVAGGQILAGDESEE